MDDSSRGSAPSPRFPRPALSAALRSLSAALLVLLFLTPFMSPAAAHLSILVDDTYGYDVYANGARSLASPRNATLSEVRYGSHEGYRLQWSPPSSGSGFGGVTGYTVYRVPGPDTAGSTVSFEVPPSWTSATDWWADQDETYVYFVTANYGSDGLGERESIPSNPVSDKDLGSYPHCAVVSVYTSPPYYDVHLSCLFPITTP